MDYIQIGNFLGCTVKATALWEGKFGLRTVCLDGRAFKINGKPVFGRWELDITDMGQIQHFLPEWLEALNRDMCHPSILCNIRWQKELFQNRY